MISFCPCFRGTGVQSIRYFYLCTLSSSSHSIAPDIFFFPFPSPSPSPSLFCKGLNCVLYPHPFKMLCTFLNDGNLLTRQDDEKTESHIRRTCSVCCDNRGGTHWLSPFRSESTSAVFLTEREGRWGPELLVLFCAATQPSPHHSPSLPFLPLCLFLLSS